MRTIAVILVLLAAGATARANDADDRARAAIALASAVHVEQASSVDPFALNNLPTTPASETDAKSRSGYVCDCAKTGKCTCPPGECDCPDCPMLHWKRVSPTLLQLRKGKNVLGSWNEATSIFTNTYGVQYEWDGKHDGDVSALTSSPATVQPVFQPQFFAPPPPMFAGRGFAGGGGGC